MDTAALAFAFAFAACAPEESPSSEPKASDLVCLDAAACNPEIDPEGHCEAVRADRFDADGSPTAEGVRLLETCSAEFEAQSSCLLEHAVCEGGSYGATACAGPCKEPCDAMTFCG